MSEGIDLIIEGVRQLLATLKGKKRRKLALQPVRIDNRPRRKQQ